MFVEEMKNPQEWDDFLRASPRGSLFHSIKWKQLIEKSFAYPAVYLVIKDEKGNIVGIFPAFVVTSKQLRTLKILDSLPHPDLGGPLIERRSAKNASIALQNFLADFCRNNGISYARLAISQIYCERYSSTLPCDVDCTKGLPELDVRANPTDFIWQKTFHKKERQIIKHFERDGYQTREAKTKSDLQTFVNLYHGSLENLNPNLIHSLSQRFFENVWEMFYPENFNIYLVEKNRTVGALGFFTYKEEVNLTYLGMKKESLASRSLAPFVFWEIIKWAETNGFKYVNFGPSALHPDTLAERSRHAYKTMFGGSITSHMTLTFPFDRYSSALLLLRPKAIQTWRAIAAVLPSEVKRKIGKTLNVIL